MKTETINITCDGCGADISPKNSSYPHDYILELRSVDAGVNTMGVTFGLLMAPPIERDLHFCGVTCVLSWAEDEKKKRTAKDARVEQERERQKQERERQEQVRRQFYYLLDADIRQTASALDT